MIEKKQLAKIVNDTYYETQEDFNNDLIVTKMAGPSR